MAMACSMATNRLPGSASPAARQFKRGAVVDRGTNDRQAQRDVDAVPKTRVLEGSQALIMVHRENTIAACEDWRREHRIGRQRPEQGHAFGTQAARAPA
jgi:hypothetical protein